jgi:hypothetical protein
MRFIVPAAAALLATHATALAGGDSNLLFNPGFEEPDPDFPSLPLGWNGINFETSDFVDINDPGAFVRTGDKAIRLTPATGDADRFKGLTTNIFRPDGSDLFDPDFVYLGGDLTMSGYYLVPEGEVIQDTIVGVKLEFRREPPNFSIWGAFEFALPDNSTGGQWAPFSFVVTDAMIQAVGDFPPQPTSVSVLPFRFFGGVFGAGTSPTGTVYMDDLRVTQGATATCPADLAPPGGDGVLNFSDVIAFLGLFNNQDLGADLNNDGVINFNDAVGFLGAFNAGCP